MVHSAPPFRLNEAQMTLLELFQHRQMNPQELESLKDTLVRYLTQELDQEVDRVMKAKNLTPEDIARRTKGLNENRTEYKENTPLMAAIKDNTEQLSPLLTKDNKLKKSYKTVEEAAQAKTDYVMKVALKDVDWSQLNRSEE